MKSTAFSIPLKSILLIVFNGLSVLLLAQKTSFTSHDALNVKSFSYSTMTDDGLWIAGTIRSGMDRKDIDHFRFGDPSYVAPYTQELIIINSETGEKRTISPAKSIINAFSFSPDGKKLAYLKYEKGKYGLYVYNITSGKSVLINIKDKRDISSSNDLLWTKDNHSVILGLRAGNWSSFGDSLYQEATVGPITVYDGNKPLLKWEEIRYHSVLNEVVKVELSSGKVNDLLPESRYDDLILT